MSAVTKIHSSAIKTTVILAVVVISLLSLPINSSGARSKRSAALISPSAYSTLVKESVWRSQHKSRLMAEMFKKGAARALAAHRSEQPVITDALQKAAQGNERDALAVLSVEIGRDILRDGVDEAIFISALTYESMGFYPEAAGNYDRIIDYYPKGSYYTRAVLARGFMELLEISRADGAKDRLLDLGGRFYRVFRNSGDPHEKKRAGAGYAVASYMAGKYGVAEKMFLQINKEIADDPEFQLIRAETYLSANKLRSAKGVLDTFLVRFGDKDEEFMPYALLRLGDAALMRGKPKEAYSYYERITGGPGSEEEVIKTLALAELSMSGEKDTDALDLLKGLHGGSVAPYFGEALTYYLVTLSMKLGAMHDALNYSKEFLSTYNLSKRKTEIKHIANDIIYKLAQSAQSEGDNYEVLGIYYENAPYISDQKILVMVGDALLDFGLTGEAEKMFAEGTILKGRLGDKMSIIGMIEVLVARGQTKEALKRLGFIRAKTDEERLWVAGVYRSIADRHFRNKEYKEALGLYARASKLNSEPALKFKIARTYGRLGEWDRAVGILKRVISKSRDEGVRAAAYAELGDIHFSSKLWREALASYNKGVEGTEGERRLWIMYKIGSLQLKAGNKKGAIEAWQKVAGMDSGYLGRLAGERVKEAGL